ncbi:transposase [bacterium]|nr:transposase [bacterium]
MSKKKEYSDEFKREAIRLQESSGKTVAEIERELGLSHNLLRQWKKRFQIDAESNTLELNEVEKLKLELSQVKRELEIVQQERDILKKTVSIFSKDGRR